MIVDNLGQAHGYGILAELDASIDKWTPSPGSVYPALVALVDAGLVIDEIVDDSRIYSATEAGRTQAAAVRAKTRWTSLSTRALGGDPTITAGRLLDQFAAGIAFRSRLVSGTQIDVVKRILDKAESEIRETIAEGGHDS